MSRDIPITQEDVDINTDIVSEEPPLYRVLLLNDDYTTMDFVVEVLVSVFRKSVKDATVIMLNGHRQGVGVCGMFPYEIAETKVDTVHSMAKEKGFPLKCIMEKA